MRQFLLFMAAWLSMSIMAQPDWAGLRRYESANAQLRERVAAQGVKVVFMGNSITEHWMELHPEFFTANGFVGRGISGQTSSQMLVRFRQDVVDLHPKVVYRFVLRETTSGEWYGQHLSLFLCELPRLKKVDIDGLDPIESWFFILKNMSTFVCPRKTRSHSRSGCCNTHFFSPGFPIVCQVPSILAQLSDSHAIGLCVALYFAHGYF